MVSQFINANTKLLTKKFEFTPGLNILFGPNGCGKSTILKAIATHGLTKKGWSNIDISPLKVGLFEDAEEMNMEKHFEREMNCKAIVDIDGPVYYVNPEVSEYEHDGYRDGYNLGSDTLSAMTELALKYNASEQSTGEACMSAQGRILSNLADGTFVFSKTVIDEMLENRKEHSNKSWYDAAKVAYDYAETTVLKGGCPTVILDEPENHFSMEITVGLFQNIIPKLIARGYQVIMATHFVLAPFMVKDTNVIAMDRDVDMLKQYMRNLLAGRIPPVDPAKVAIGEHESTPEMPGEPSTEDNCPDEYMDVEFVVDPADNVVDGNDDDPLAPKMPFLVKYGRKRWKMKFRIDVKTGNIVGWPEGTLAKVYQKVCDSCSIMYYKDGGKYLFASQEDDYAPDFLYYEEWNEHADDLVAFDVEPDGHITGWESAKNQSAIRFWANCNRS